MSRDIRVNIPTDLPFEEIIKQPINELALQWLINRSIHDRFDGSAKAFMLKAVNLANIYKEELKAIYDAEKAIKEEQASAAKPKKFSRLGIE